MKGYKGMSKDMQCRGMQYEIGKTYHVYGEIALCRNGLHFCERLKDVFNYYSKDSNSRYFEVYAGGQIECGWDKSAASELTILRELTDIEVNRCAYDNGYGCDYEYNSNGYGFGDGYRNGNGDGSGRGCGHNYADGDGGGNGNGYSNGNGYGDGDGDGYDYGNMSRILFYKGE